LLVAVHIGETVQLPHLCQHDRSPFHEVLQVLTLNRVLVLRVALSAADAHVLPCLQECHRARDSTELWSNTVDHFTRTDFSFSKRLQRDINKTAVGRAVAADEVDHRGDCRISLDRVTHPQCCALHRLKRRVLRALHTAKHGPVILLRKKSFRNSDEKKSSRRDCRDQDAERNRRVPQNNLQAAFVTLQNPRENISG